jgi:hypothetical protein
MSSSPTAPTSTTASSSSCLSLKADVIACGALAGHVREIVARRGWPVAVRALPAILHNRPQKITILAERAVVSALRAGRTAALAYADCGTYGALDELCARYRVRRLPGLHCYDVFAGPSRIEAMLSKDPGTYLLTDFLLRSFDRSVLAELGLDSHPELWPDYFGHYRRLVWLAQEPSQALAAEADRIAAMFGLPLTRIDTGVSRLEQALGALVQASRRGAALPGLRSDGGATREGDALRRPVGERETP